MIIPILILFSCFWVSGIIIELIEINRFKSTYINQITFDNIKEIMEYDVIFNFKYQRDIANLDIIWKLIMILILPYVYCSIMNKGNVYIWEFKKIKRIKRLYKLKQWVCLRNQKWG
jgi:hypothetical protein